ncbi:MAG: 2OG-Fe(II) oxygenase [Gammaproteobacteria bacterium]|nr:2OG-Fe(II) oxygenase [Gammaproteobacteria bacterium]
MDSILLQNIIDALVTIDAETHSNRSSAFYAAGDILPSDIAVVVDGIGPIDFPVSSESVQQLLALSSKAKFGLREQTLLDENVRNTHEITADKLQVIIGDTVLSEMLGDVRDALGFDADSQLVPHLHNLLVYGPGQFFDKHKDSEKLDHMVATLVIVLPSRHIGGDFVIEHGRDSYIFSSENIDAATAKYMAFYADCTHAVEKVRQGYRVVLTYNLVLESKTQPVTKNTSPLLKKAISTYFEETAVDTLVYFLDHSYSEHSLRWDMLKGADRLNANAMRSAAKALGYLTHLALVEIRESWDTDGDEDDPELYELIDGEITFNYWVGEHNQRLPYGDYYAANDTICWTRETRDLEPFEEEYEGYMGNYGNTVDYWYRRAAVVLWPESKQTLMDFKLNYENAFNALLILTDAPGNESKVKDKIKQSGEDFYGHYGCYQSDKKPGAFFNIAAYIKDKTEAFDLLTYFEWKVLNTDAMNSLALIQTQYGVDFCLTLLKHWQSKGKPSVLDNIDTLVSTFVASGGDVCIVTFLLSVQTDAMIRDDSRSAKLEKPLPIQKRLPTRLQSIEQLLAACALIHDVVILNKVIDHLIAFPALYPETHLAALLLKMKSTVEPAYFRHYQKLKEHLTESIQMQLTANTRATDDWSIITKLLCNCEYCKIAAQFLRAKGEVTKVWPIAMAIREHIKNVFHDSGLPIELLVEKKGSPHKLILTKTSALHRDAQKKHKELNLYREKLDDLLV